MIVIVYFIICLTHQNSQYISLLPTLQITWSDVFLIRFSCELAGLQWNSTLLMYYQLTYTCESSVEDLS